MRPHDEARTDVSEAIVVRPGAVGGRWGEPDEAAVGGDEARLRGQIDETRAEMSETIEAIQERLSPDRVGEQVSHVADQVKEQIRESVQELTTEAKERIREATVGRVEHMIDDARESVNDLRYGIMDRVRANPVPAALAGIGLAWLLFSDGGGRSRRYYRREERQYRGAYRGDRYGYGARPGYAERFHEEDEPGAAEQFRQRAEQARAQAGRAVGDAREGAERLVGDARERVDELTDVAEQQLGRARDRFGELLGDSPLAIGAIALGVGAAVGLAMPVTEQENEWMGDTRDQLLGRAKEVVAEAGEQARAVAEEKLGKSE
jgi:ElaB/YqjD/DUF883 family membrane-anchored ribosome-binding protein